MGKPVAIDLFSGCGGLTLGLKLAGFDVLGAIEIDSLAVETYRENHPDAHIWHEDIRDVSCRNVRDRLGLRKGELDLLAGCPPCQGFSSIKTLNGRKGMKDARNDLVFEILRFVRELRPKAVMMENVPGLARDSRMKRIVGELQRLGYLCRFDVLDASLYGVPQRRRRLILLAGLNGEIPFGKPAKNRHTVRDAFRKLVRAPKNDPLSVVKEKRSEKIEELIRLIPKDGGSRMDLGAKRQLECHQRCDGFKDIYGRMSWDDVAPTITGGCVNPSKGRFLHPTKNRAISLREAALLQSFPPTYFFSLRKGKFSAAQMIGNALPPEFIRRHARAIRERLPNLGRP